MTAFEQRLRDLLSHAYDIERELGGGGMSRVFVATDRSLGRKVVIKLLSPELTAEVNRGRFRREIQVAAQLQHPHIVTLLSAGEDGDLVYYTMPFITGESLKSALEKSGRLSVRDVVRVLYDVVDALAYAHDHGVVHRDIKPANILRSGAHALVTDFGVAKALDAAMPSSAMTSTGMAIGTPAYMAPEQLAGDPSADHRIDIYAVGLLAYELLAGKSPFAASSPQGVLAAVLTHDPKPVIELREDVPRRLSEMIMQCLSKVPGGRPPTAEALLVALDMFSTASGEIRTREYRVPVIEPTMPVVAESLRAITPHVPAPAIESTAPVAAPLAPSVAQSVAPPVAVEKRPSRSRKRYFVAGLAVLLPAAAGAILLSQRASLKPSSGNAPVAVTDSTGVDLAVVAPVSAMPITELPAAAPIDSLAIAEAVKKRLTQAEAPTKAGQPAINTDSLRRSLHRQIADSIARARPPVTAALTPAPVAPPVAPPVAAPPPAPSGKRRLAIADPRHNNDHPALNSFSRSLVDALRGALDNADGFALVDQDSVRGVLARTSSRDEAAKVLRPDVLVAPNYAGTGEAMNVVVMVWDLRSNSSFGIRVTSTRVSPTNPEVSLGPVVQSVLKQLNDLERTPTIYRRGETRTP